MAVKTELDDVNGRIKYLKKLIQPDLMRVGFKVKLHLVRNWLKGLGADGKKFKRLTPAYRKRKQKHTGRGQADLLLSGRLQQSLEPKKRKGSVVVTFSQAEMGKARGNFEVRPNMMILDADTKNEMVEFIYKRLKKTKGEK